MIKIINKRINDLFYTFIPFSILLLFIYPFKLSMFPSISFVLLSFFVIYFSVNNKKKIFLLIDSKNILYIYIGLFLILIFTGISHLANLNFEFTYYLLVLKFIVAIFISICIVLYFYKKRFDVEVFIDWFIVLSFILSLFCIVEFFIPQAKQLISSVFISTDNETYETSFRVKGFVSGGGAGLSYVLALAVLFSQAFFFKYDNFKYILRALTITIAIIFVGRTGLIIAFLGWSYFLLKFFTSLKLKNIFYIFALVAVLVVAMSNLSLSEDDLKIITRYSFELFYNFIQTGEFTSKSTEALGGMYFIPELKHFLIGEGIYGAAVTYDNVDIGYYRQLLSTGIFGLLIFYLIMLFMQYKIYIYFKYIVNSKFLLLILLSFWIVEAKEPVFIQNYTARLMILMYIITIVYNDFLRLKYEK